LEAPVQAVIPITNSISKSRFMVVRFIFLFSLLFAY
jgi:hypothetical protein